VAEGDFGYRMEVGIPDEFGRIATAINEMVTRLEIGEENLRTALANAEQANQAKSLFLANMSHELRTPLNAIIGFADIIKNQHLGPDSVEKYSEYAQDIWASGNHLLTLVNDILNLSAIEAGKYILKKERLAVREIVDDCSRVVANLAAAKGVRYASELPEDLPWLYADRRAVKQILLNLLSNAIKFTPPGGLVSLSASASDGKISIEVRDTDIGIAASFLPSLAHPFVRGEIDPLETQDGSGLGLAIVKSLVDLHEGQLTIESRIDRGTTVTVTLPNAAP
jgi:two-component system cell cycle sensor histidine kinase PleC